MGRSFRDLEQSTICFEGGNRPNMFAAILKGVGAIVLIFILYQVYRLLENWGSKREGGR
jgi:hypothetical protein